MTASNGRFGRAALLAAVAAAAYLPALEIGFLHDDFFEFLHPARFAGLAASVQETWTPRPGENFFRPLVDTTLLLTATAVGAEAVWFRATDLVFHVVVVLLAARGASVLVDRRAGLVVGLLFAVHPLPGRAVLWTSDRYVVLATLFTLITLLAFLRWRRTGARWALVAALLAQCAALCSKESALAIPVALAVVAWVWGRQPPLAALRAVALFVLLDLAYLGLRYAAYGDLGGYRAPDGSRLAPLGPGRVATEALLDLPVRCLFPFNRDRISGLIEIGLGAVVVACIAWVATRSGRPRWRDALGGLALGYALLIPSAPYFYLGRDLLKAYHIYPVAFGFGIAAASLLRPRAGQRRSVRAAFAVLLITYGVVDHLHARSWIDATRQVRAFGAWLRAIEPPIDRRDRLWIAGLPHVMRGALLLEPNRMRVNVEVLVDHPIADAEGLGHPWTRASHADVVESMTSGARLLRWGATSMTGREITLGGSRMPRVLVDEGRALAGDWEPVGEFRRLESGRIRFEGRDGGFRWRGLPVDQPLYRGIRVVMRAQSDADPEQVCNVRWTTVHYSPGRIRRLGRIPIVADGEWHTYELDLVRTGWISESLKIDTMTVTPASVSVEAEVASLTLLPW